MKSDARNEPTARWFVEPLSKMNNEATMAELAYTCGATEENIYRNRLDDKDVPHNVVEIKRFFVNNIERQSNAHDLYRIYVQQEGRTRMRLWAFGKPSNHPHNRKIIEVAKQIGGLRQK